MALYGQVAIPRMFCEACQGTAFVLDNRLACCNKAMPNLDCHRRVRVSDVAMGRSGPSKKWREFILKMQEHRCYYCNRLFGGRVYRGTKEIRLKLHWDHVNPYVYSLNNRDQNFVAACHVCNGIKSAFVFNRLEEVLTYVQGKWEEKGYRDSLPEVRLKLYPETSVAKLL